MRTFINEELGILTGLDRRDLVMLFHIDQVWINHPSIGYCNYTEIHPKTELSKHLYPGRPVLCWAREVAAGQANHQVSNIEEKKSIPVKYLKISMTLYIVFFCLMDP